MKMRTIEVDQQQKEICNHGTDTFPMTIHYDNLRFFQGHCIPFHWHPTLEVVVTKRNCSVPPPPEHYFAPSRKSSYYKFQCISQHSAL